MDINQIPKEVDELLNDLFDYAEEADIRWHQDMIENEERQNAELERQNAEEERLCAEENSMDPNSKQKIKAYNDMINLIEVNLQLHPLS
jgi:hypothetical protein